MRRRLAALGCAAALCAGLILPAAAAADFTDVAAGAWYEQAVEEVAEMGLMSGVSDTLFLPDGTVTRATVAVVLWRMDGRPAAQSAGHFPDVPAESWYAAAADWACEAEIIIGTDKGLFNGDSPVTRQELAVMLSRYDAYHGQAMAEGALALYSDAGQVASWAEEGMAHAVGMGLLEGADGKLSPKDTTTRAQMAVILQRMNIQAMG